MNMQAALVSWTAGKTVVAQKTHKGVTEEYVMYNVAAIKAMGALRSVTFLIRG